MSSSLIPYRDTSYSLKTDLPSDFGAVTTAYCAVRNRAGTNMYASGSATAFADAGGGNITVTSATHGLTTGDYIHIWDTTSYNGYFEVTVVDANTFTIADTYVAAETSGTWELVYKAAPLAISTLGAAATRMAASITLGGTVTNAPTAGDLIQIRANSSGPAESVRVDAYNSSTKVATLRDYLQHDHASGATVYGRGLSTTIDVSGTAFTRGLELYAEWSGFDTDDLPFRTTLQIMGTASTMGDLEGKFSTLYPHYYAVVESNFDAYKDQAYSELRIKMSGLGRELDTLVDSQNIEPLLLVSIAYTVAWSQGDEWETERTYIKARRDELFDQFVKLLNWFDENQDGIQDEPSEISPTDRPWPRRVL